MSERNNVLKFSRNRQRRPQRSNNQNGDGRGDEDWGSRLRDVEDAVLVIQTKFENLATKEDLKDLKIWWLLGILAGMVGAATIALAVVRIFGQ